MTKSPMVDRNLLSPKYSEIREKSSECISCEPSRDFFMMTFWVHDVTVVSGGFSAINSISQCFTIAGDHHFGATKSTRIVSL